MSQADEADDDPTCCYNCFISGVSHFPDAAEHVRQSSTVPFVCYVCDNPKASHGKAVKVVLCDGRQLGWLPDALLNVLLRVLESGEGVVYGFTQKCVRGLTCYIPCIMHVHLKEDMPSAELTAIKQCLAEGTVICYWSSLLTDTGMVRFMMKDCAVPLHVKIELGFVRNKRESF